MSRSLFYFLLISLFWSGAGCATAQLPSEDIEAPVMYRHLISVLKNPKLPPNSREKYEAAKELIKHVDFHYTRETKTVNTYLHHRDAVMDNPGSDRCVFTFTYRHGDHFVRLRFFTFRMMVLRVEIVEE